MKAIITIFILMIFIIKCDNTTNVNGANARLTEIPVKSDLRLMGVKGDVRSIKNTTFYANDFSVDSVVGYTKETFYVFNESGDRIGKDPSHGGITSYIYEGDEEKDRNVRHNPDEEISYNEIYKVNSHGLLISHNILDKDSNTIFEELYKYNNDQDIIESSRNDLSRDVSYKEKFSYKTRGLLKEHSKYVIYNNYSQRVSMTKYNMYGDIDEVFDTDFYGEADSSVTVSSYSYEYDKKGNWIKKSMRQESRIVLVDYRDIEYY